MGEWGRRNRSLHNKLYKPTFLPKFMKKLWVILIVGALIALPVAWYLISPLWRVVEVDEASPLIKDAMDSMDAATKAEFEAAVKEMSKEIMVMDDELPSPAVAAQGEFKPRAHDVMGRALLIDDAGKKILRFEDFDTVNGPDLHIYLSSELGDEDFIDLGKIKATKGNVNYELPDGIDTKKYNKVLVWCKPFGVLFSYSVLS
jgi:hypothetical protein